MKKLTALFLVLVMALTVTVVTASAVDYAEPFAPGTMGSKTYRIPGIWTLNNGGVFAVADMRYDHGSDSPNNIDILFAKSEDGYKEWSYSMPNYFGDYADTVTDTNSASFIDSAVAQSSTDRIFVVSDVCPSGGGYWKAQKGTGFVDVNGKNYLLLTSGDYTASLDTFAYYMGDFVDGVATVYNRADNTATAYTVDENLDLYKNGKVLTMEQVGGEGKIVNQNIFYSVSELTCYLTTYLVLRTSDDLGETWNAPVFLSAQIKKDNEGFLGIGPGRGFVTEVDGKERVIFCVYDNVGNGATEHNENVSTIYSDDDGITWKRGAETKCRLFVIKTSEAQIVELGDGTLRMFARNKGRYISYADSTDGGHSWSRFRSDLELPSNANCMMSFINAEVNGQQFVLGSYTSNKRNRADGIIKVGVVDGNDIKWVNTYNINDGFFAYSCLTQLADGKIAMLYEDEAAKVSYMILTLGEDGSLTEINGNNYEGEPSVPFVEKLTRAFFYLVDGLLEIFDLI